MRKKFILLTALLLLCMPVFAGSLFYADNPSTIVSAIDSTLNAGTQMVTGQCNVQSITIGGYSTSAGDYALIYDNTSATGTPKFDIGVGTAKDSFQIILNDAEFGTGVFADSNDDNVIITIEYTQN